MIEKPLQLGATLIDAVRAIEGTFRRMAVVVDSDNKLVGTLTDGDIRRYIIASGSLDDSVENAMNIKPLFAQQDAPDGYIKDLMRIGNVTGIPLLDNDGKYIRLVHLTDIEKFEYSNKKTVKFSFAVIMAGGEGTRLRPLTENLPKPMVKVGGVPLLERQIQRLVEMGIPRVYISVNYLSHIIEEYFGNGHGFGIEVCYLREDEKLGTAGALTLLPEQPNGHILVMNGDILTTSDLESFYQFHENHDAYLTVAAIDYRVNIPYGVILAEASYVKGLVEKPSKRYLCNAGIYALSPNVLDLLPNQSYCNMTDLVGLCLNRNFPVAVFPVHEYWNDIGTPDDLEKARLHFSNIEINR